MITQRLTVPMPPVEAMPLNNYLPLEATLKMRATQPAQIYLPAPEPTPVPVPVERLRIIKPEESGATALFFALLILICLSSMAVTLYLVFH